MNDSRNIYATLVPRISVGFPLLLRKLSVPYDRFAEFFWRKIGPHYSTTGSCLEISHIQSITETAETVGLS